MKTRIVPNFKIYAIATAVVLLAAAVMGIFTGGLNLGIDFSGGSLITIELGQDFNTSDVESALASLGVGEYSVSKTGDAGANTQASVRVRSMPTVEEETAMVEALVAALSATYPGAQRVSVDTVGAVAGAQLVRNAVLAVVIASALMLIYIWIRFELVSGVIAVVALVINVVMMIAAMVFCSSFLQINSSFIAACLTIVGYAINNNIIVLDRLRENNKKYPRKSSTRKEVAEISVHSCMGRMINTTVTTLLTITALYILGVESIREFALPLIIGIACGTFISIFITPALWGTWMDKRKLA